jgi:hypothetical protein
MRFVTVLRCTAFFALAVLFAFVGVACSGTPDHSDWPDIVVPGQGGSSDKDPADEEPPEEISPIFTITGNVPAGMNAAVLVTKTLNAASVRCLFGGALPPDNTIALAIALAALPELDGRGGLMQDNTVDWANNSLCKVPPEGDYTLILCNAAAVNIFENGFWKAENIAVNKKGGGSVDWSDFTRIPQIPPDPPEQNAAQPIISVQPANGQYMGGESAAPLSVLASVNGGGTLSYQWYTNTAESTQGAVQIAGETKNYYIPCTAEEGVMYYFVRVVNTNPDAVHIQTAEAISAFARIAVTKNAEAPTIHNQPVSANYIVGAPAAALTVAASISDGGTLTYQWFRNTEADTESGTAIPGAVNASYTPGTAAQGNMYYYVRITNTNNNVSGTKTAFVISGIVQISVGSNAALPVISLQPAGKTYIGEAAVPLRVQASISDGGTLTYQWFRNTANSTAGATAIAGATGTSYTPPIASAGTVFYFVRITNTNNAVMGEPVAVATSSIAPVTVRLWAVAANNPAAGRDLDFIAYGNGRFVVSANGMMLHSTDGNAWTQVPGFTSTLRDITFGNGRFVAGVVNSPLGRTAHSDTGTSWTISAVSPAHSTNSINAMTFGNGRFVAGLNSSGGRMMYSDNGTTWVGATGSPFRFTFIDTVLGPHSIAYGNNRWVAVGSTGRIIVSTNNGVNWSQVQIHPFGVSSIQRVVYAGNRFIAGSVISGIGVLAHSTDGINWTPIPDHPFEVGGVGRLYYANGLLFGVTLNSPRVIAYSDDYGATWTSITSNVFPPASSSFPSVIAYGGGRLVIGFSSFVDNSRIVWCQWP